MESELILTGMFLGTGLLAYVVIPGMLVMWDRVTIKIKPWKMNNPAHYFLRR